MDDILRRIERELGVADAAERLATRIQQADLHSLLLHVFERRARERTPADVLADYATNRFARPSLADPVALARFDQAAFAALPASFQALELSPVAPLAASSALATVHQNKALASIRSVEVLSDATNVLALECALRRKALLRADTRSAEPVQLAASHRHLRTQAFTPQPNFSAHFRLFALCSAGRDSRDERFHPSALDAHLRFYARIARESLGPAFAVRIALTDLASAAATRSLAPRLPRRRGRVRPGPGVGPRLLRRGLLQDPRPSERGRRRVARARRRRLGGLDREAPLEREGAPGHQRDLERANLRAGQRPGGERSKRVSRSSPSATSPRSLKPAAA